MSDDYLKSKKLRKRRRNDGRVDVVGTDVAGTEYTALTTDGAEVTPSDIDALHRGDPDIRDARAFTGHFIQAHEAHKKEYADAMQSSYEEGVEDVLRDSFRRSPRQCNVPIGTKVVFGSLGHPAARCYFSDQGGCDYCY